jgi:hypothetical protein
MNTTAIKSFFKKHFQLIFIAILVIVGITFRFLPHPPNFTPIAAIGLFSGLLIKRKGILLVPLTVMLISDLFIGLYQPTVMISVYFSFGLIAVLGYLIKKVNFSNIIGSSLFGSIIFFTLTNLAVWQFSGLYPLTGEGLMNCFYLALPFFRNTIAGDLFFATIFYASYQLAKNYLTIKSSQQNKLPI